MTYNTAPCDGVLAVVIVATSPEGGDHDRIQCRAFQGEGGARTAIPRRPHNEVAFAWPGLRHVNIVKTGEHTFCVIGEWTDMDAIANARASMIATLNSFRDTLEDLGGGLGVTDPVSGPVVKALK